MKLIVETTTGITTIDTDHIAAITKNESGGRSLMFPSRTYHLDIHLASGTIFNAELSEQAMISLYWGWEGNLEEDNEKEEE